MQTTADMIRGWMFATYFLPNLYEGSVTFSVGEVMDNIPFPVQQQQIVGACGARTPLARFGITAIATEGANANRHQQWRWTWDPPPPTEEG